METEFIYERVKTPVGVKVELVSGSEQRSGNVWRAMALQVYKENGRDGYRDVVHTADGAPLLYSEPERISVTHTDHLLAVATLPPTPEVDLERFSERAALGIDAERTDREQVLKVRPRFLTEQEQALIPAGSLEANILAWTAKEAVYKAALTPGLDFQSAIRITALPVPGGALGSAEADIPVPTPEAAGAEAAGAEAAAEVRTVPFRLCSFAYGEYLLTLAITPRTATWAKAR